jgi:hypothetical protein
LLFSLLAVAGITVWYVYQARHGIPGPSSLVGYGLASAGFVLMLGTEVLYSLRKRMHGFNFGPMQTWLRWHVFTGLVGPYLVLLHSGGKFHGLAGVLALVTVFVVVSGFIGRYLYTAVPRTLEGIEAAIPEDQTARARRQSLAATRRLLALWYLFHVPLGGVLFLLAFLHIGAALYYAAWLR